MCPRAAVRLLHDMRKLVSKKAVPIRRTWPVRPSVKNEVISRGQGVRVEPCRSLMRGRADMDANR